MYRNTLLAYYRHKYISCQVRTIIREAITTLYEKIQEVKQRFFEDGLPTHKEVESIIKAKIIDLNKKDKIIPSSSLSRNLSTNNLSVYRL